MKAVIENGKLIDVFSKGAFHPHSPERLAAILDDRARREIAERICR